MLPNTPLRNLAHHHGIALRKDEKHRLPKPVLDHRIPQEHNLLKDHPPIGPAMGSIRDPQVWSRLRPIEILDTGTADAISLNVFLYDADGVGDDHENAVVRCEGAVPEIHTQAGVFGTEDIAPVEFGSEVGDGGRVGGFGSGVREAD